ADLIARLGADDFRAREAASAALERIGEGALPALRQALLADDLEVRHRAEALVERLAWQEAVRELGRLEGTWTDVAVWENGQESVADSDAVVRTVIRHGESVSADGRGVEVRRGVWHIIDADCTPCKADILTSDGRVFRAIYRLDGDMLKYC